MPTKETLFQLISWGLVASIGGFARFLAGRLEKDAEKLSKGNFCFQLFANVCVSGFSGLMGAMMMSMVTNIEMWHFSAAGIFGFLGVRGLEMLADKINQKL